MATGKTLTNGYGTSNSCINNTDFMNAFFARLERLIAETNPDGIMQDEIHRAQVDDMSVNIKSEE